jgi:hypothetical protein
MFTTPQDLFTQATKYMAAIPKTTEEVQAVLTKAKTVAEVEAQNAKEVIATYNKATRGDASINEITQANKKAQELMVAARFATVLAMPGGIFMMPMLIEASKEFDFDFVPASVSKEFGI